MDGPRLLFVGTSGSGKSTAARMAAQRLGLRHIELDSIRHQAGWTEMPDEQFRRVVADHAAGDAWVIDGNYSSIVGDITRQRATHVVWVNPPKHTVMAQVVWRSLTRAVLRTELWNGNRERFRGWVTADHPIRWAWSTYGPNQRALEQAMTDKWIRLRSRHALRRWLAALTTANTASAAYPG